MTDHAGPWRVRCAKAICCVNGCVASPENPHCHKCQAVFDYGDAIPSVLAEFLAALREPAMVKRLALLIYREEHGDPDASPAWDRYVPHVHSLLNLLTREVGGESGGSCD